jgi:tetrahydromethanopterin S-methyltransferase subunit A
MARLLNEGWDIFSGTAVDEKAIERQKVHIEIEIIDMQDSDAIRDAIKKLGYARTFFGLTPDQHIKMEFEKKR